MARTVRTPEEKKAAQAIAHRKWRQSERGKEYYLRRKIEKHTKPSLAEELSPKIEPSK